MYRSFLSVSGFTLLSRLTGFLRDVMLAGLIGEGMMGDALAVALRLPNHFRAIFGEGAFNAAYVPTYLRVYEQSDIWAARHFANQIFTLLLISQVVMLALGWIFMPSFVHLLAPGFAAHPEKFDLAVKLTRITFPYLFCVTLVTMHSATLNAHGKFAVAAFAPVLLNVFIMAFLAIAFLFPNAAYAAAAGVTASGLAQLALLMSSARRLHLMEKLARPTLSADVRSFFRMFGPAVIGSSGLQIAMFADTIIGSMLPTGGLSSIYYAERLYQLPIGLVGVAAGTVLLPEMSRCFAREDWAGAFTAQNRTLALTFALTAPFVVAFMVIPDVIVRALFQHGMFSAADTAATAAVLRAYGSGLVAIVAINALRSGFQAMGDTKTPMLVSLGALAINLLLKILLYKPLGAVGIALATSANAWINLVALVIIGLRRYLFQPDDIFKGVALAAATAAVVLANIALWLQGPFEALGHRLGIFGSLIALALFGLVGLLVYGGAVVGGCRALGVTAAQMGLGRLVRKKA
ncbi:murein biosynthesis integral membrane protein MurJ [Rhodoblastus acidophilus]|uniref:Probable lipid II flippase MurJ n=1 Tax=Candidatus Rhodoblastus alkanivorans TaxID=2954117 RepID=A0ABS9Z9G3_9HYPH|nr:murein biosynthesis integral membrane protein MurJ [Candidatus Rhodoblastus alkanivorans]MCI4679787.1 murein biosynthesis integral membrane protein MurJ [Candidatus Rhodoblastus alkanivorans]MCI4684293.1 murein biosynthesis integral membrane protein MurJ [Candidatus Rhodoblastus alkanivorans]MDI4641613.1 murein biosynthesis integral membrane protein MurJ [Rhodoblastus acidophilus]